jgi:hypothetical protein
MTSKLDGIGLNLPVMRSKKNAITGKIFGKVSSQRIEKILWGLLAIK